MKSTLESFPCTPFFIFCKQLKFFVFNAQYYVLYRTFGLLILELTPYFVGSCSTLGYLCAT